MHNLNLKFWERLYCLGLYFTKRNIDSESRALIKHDTMTTDDIKKLQMSRLKEILCYAGDNIPYYQRVFAECNFNPNDFASLEDLQKLPYLDKDIVNQVSDELINPKLRDEKIPRKTGGSTGNKLVVYYDPKSLDITAAVVQRCLLWTGKQKGDKEVHFSSNVNINISWKDKIREWAKCLALHRKNIFLDVFNDDTFEHILDELEHYHPYLVQGFPSIAYALAKYAERVGRDVKNIFTVYESTGETVYSFQREKIEKIFDCELFDRYGNAEFGVIAYECQEHDGLHVQSDVVYVETPILANGGKSEIVVTTLTNHIMPLIRYRTGDLAELVDKSCPCGLPYPKLSKMQGRIHDFLKIDDGLEASTTFFLDLFDRYGGFNDFQIQKHNDGLHIYVHPLAELQLDSLKEFQKTLYESLQEKIKINIHIVPRLLTTSAGKFRYIIGDNIQYDLSSQEEIAYNITGRIDCHNECMNFPVVNDVMCIEGFYNVETNTEGRFIWAKCQGKIKLQSFKNTLEILSLTKRYRQLVFYSEEQTEIKKLPLNEGWNLYDIAELPSKKWISFVVSEPIDKEAVNNDSRELAFGLREFYEREE